jgi:hypothetical protein
MTSRQFLRKWLDTLALMYVVLLMMGVFWFLAPGVWRALNLIAKGIGAAYPHAFVISTVFLVISLVGSFVLTLLDNRKDKHNG